MKTNPDMRILGWLASVGAASAADIAAVCEIGPRAAGARLRGLESARLSRSVRLLHGEPALHALTRRGLSAAGRREYEPTRISVSNFGHLLAVSEFATALRQAGRTVCGEKELRALERAGDTPLASAAIGIADDGS